MVVVGKGVIPEMSGIALFCVYLYRRGAPSSGRAGVKAGCISVMVNYRKANSSAFLLLFIRTILLSSLSTLLLWLVFSLLSFRIAGLSFLKWTFFLSSSLLGGYLLKRTHGESLKELLTSILKNQKLPERNFFESPTILVPDMLDDICRALYFVLSSDPKLKIHHNIPDLLSYLPTEVAGKVDFSRVFLSGHSAGAHLISLITLDRTYSQRVGITQEMFEHSIKGSFTLLF